MMDMLTQYQSLIRLFDFSLMTNDFDKAKKIADVLQTSYPKGETNRAEVEYSIYQSLLR